MKKLISIITVTLMLFSMAACGKNEEKQEVAGSTSSGKISAEPLELSILYHARNAFVFDNDWPVFQKAFELTNIKLKSTVAQTTTDSEQAFTLAMASGELADLMFVNQIQLNKYAPDGAFMPLNDLIDKYAPNIKRVMEENPDFRRAITNDDGQIYYIVGVGALPEDKNIKALASNGYFIRKDWLDNLKMPIPDTLDEYEATLRAFKEKDPNGNGQADEIPFFAANAGELARIPVNLTGGRTNWYVTDDGKIGFGPYDPEYKEGLKLAKKWYAEGLADKEIFTRGANSRDILFANNTGGATRGFFGSTLSYNTQMSEKIPGFNLVWMLPPKGTDGTRLEETSSAVSAVSNVGGLALSATNKHPEESMKYIDFWFSEEGSRLAEFGIEGEHYDMVDGKPVAKDSLINGTEPAINVLRNIGSNQLLPYLASGDLTRQTTGKDALEGQDKYAEEGVLAIPLPPLVFTNEESEVIRDYLGGIATYYSEMQAKWLLGESDIDAEFDTYREKMKAMGMDECIAVYQAAYDRYVSK